MADEIPIHPPDPQPTPLILQPTPTTHPISPPLTDPLDSTNTNPNPPKRQRRPSVRLGEIGDPTYDPHHSNRQRTKWQQQPNSNTNKTRPLTNLVVNTDNTKQPKFRKPTSKRARTNWSKFELPVSVVGGLVEENGNNDDQLFRVENSESPGNSGEENMGLQYWDKLSRGNANANNNTTNNSEEESVLGVRDWLNGLGLGKYGPVFDVHEVDEEVLPLLTLEDLKDMGISAVGSRRKMYSAILKLKKGLS